MAVNVFWMSLVVLAIFVGSGSALRCWDCSSNVNALCNDPMNTTEHQAIFHVKDCRRGPYANVKTVCRKIVTREDGERVVIRSCSMPNHDEMETSDGPCSPQMMSGRSIVESCHICSTDLCNSASGLSTMRSLYFTGLALILYRFFFESKYEAVM
ncbi:hypothetical protein KPH14_003950 [Odynerus spinipes]|uniref:Protein sleepless n=1 Tax=Odynerus spinipes TaxID=1348599 RepID=A0AAD9VUW6_9HYME|nr:hypothetical protein KPH14_003950 [Odynerus spinipes]